MSPDRGPPLKPLLFAGLLVVGPAGRAAPALPADRCAPRQAVGEAGAAYREGGSRRLLERLAVCRSASPCGPSTERAAAYCAAMDQAAVVLDRQAVQAARDNGQDDKYPGDPRLGRGPSQQRIAAACRDHETRQGRARCLARADAQREAIEADTLRSLRAGPP